MEENRMMKWKEKKMGKILDENSDNKNQIQQKVMERLKNIKLLKMKNIKLLKM